MWSNVISIDKAYDREIDYILGKLQRTKEVSYAVEESKDRMFIYLAGMCEKQQIIEDKLMEIFDVLYLSFFKLRFFLDKLHIGKLTHARCALICSIIHFDREFESNVISKVLSTSSDYNVDGIYNFRLAALSEGWQELAELASRLLEGCENEADIYDIASFITGSEGKKSRLVLEKDALRNLTSRQGVEIVNLFDSEEYNMLSAIIKEKPLELLLENCDFTAPMNDTLRKIARVVQK